MPFYEFEGVKPVVSSKSYIHPTAVIIGDVWIAENCYIGPCASLRGDFGRIRICQGANVQDCCVLHSFPDKELILHENAHLGHGAIVHSAVVENDAMVGMHAVVLDHAVVGQQAIIAANSTVPTHCHVPPRVLFAGVPGEVKRKLSQENIKAKQLATIAYHQLTQRSLSGLHEAEPLRQASLNRPQISWQINFDANFNTKQ